MRKVAERPAPLNAYVSASSRGLAFEIARHLAVGGANVALSSRSPTNLDAARAAILSAAPDVRVLTVTGDLSCAADQGRILDTLDSSGFQPHIFVCNCGQPEDATLESLERPHWEHDVTMVLDQAVFGAKKFAPFMAKAGYGRFLFISSVHAKTPAAGSLTSSIARAGLFALSKAIVADYARYGVASFPLCLGYVDTPLLRNMALGRAFDAPDPAVSREAGWESKYEGWADAIPSNRIASMDELADLVSFLVSPAADYLNGSVLSFSGGLDRGLV